MGDWSIDTNPNGDPTQQHNGGGQQNRQQWVRANFTEIFGTSAEALQASGTDPRQYARDHRDQIRQFAQAQRRQGIAVPRGGGGGPGGSGVPGGPGGSGGYSRRPYPYGGGRGGMGMRGGSAWIGVLIALFALRFLLVDSFAGAHAAVFWVLGIGGVMLVARVTLFSWLRRRRFNRRRPDGPSGGRSGF
jgi:hypothetical protein